MPVLVHNHTIGKFVYGFRMLAFGWSDGNTFIPITLVIKRVVSEYSLEVICMLKRVHYTYEEQQYKLVHKKTWSC